jgi:hypothetical protein
MQTSKPFSAPRYWSLSMLPVRARPGAAEVEVVALYDDGRGNNLYEKAVDEILGRECEKLGCALEDGEAVDASLGKVMGFEVEGC